MKRKMILVFGILLTACNTDESVNSNNDQDNTISEEETNDTSKKL